MLSASLWGFQVAQWWKNLPANAADVGSVSGAGRSPGEGNGNPFQYPCLENFMDRGAHWATVHGVTKSWTWLSKWTGATSLYRWNSRHSEKCFTGFSTTARKDTASPPYLDVIKLKSLIFFKLQFQGIC